MSASSPVWLSLTKNAFDDDSGRPVLTGGIGRRLVSDYCPSYDLNSTIDLIILNLLTIIYRN
jgi:hypothetical protein